MRKLMNHKKICIFLLIGAFLPLCAAVQAAGLEVDKKHSVSKKVHSGHARRKLQKSRSYMSPADRDALERGMRTNTLMSIEGELRRQR